MRDVHGRLHDVLGRFSLDDARPGTANREPRSRRAAAAFQPRMSATDRRVNLQGIREAVDVFNKPQSSLTFRERQRREWASPKKRAEQMAKTGDVLIPRREGMRREAALGGRDEISLPNRAGGHRDTIIRNPRTGKLEAKRGTREVVLPGGKTVAARRAGRAFNLPPKPGKTAASRMASGKATPTAATPTYTSGQLALATPARLREIAASLGITVPPRAGHRQITDLILARQR